MAYRTLWGLHRGLISKVDDPKDVTVLLWTMLTAASLASLWMACLLWRWR